MVFGVVQTADRPRSAMLDGGFALTESAPPDSFAPEEDGVVRIARDLMGTLENTVVVV